MDEHHLTEARWALVERTLPGKAGDPGCSGRDNRLFLEAVLWIARSRQPWRELPKDFGKWYTAYTRFRRWSKKGVWPNVFAALRQDDACEYMWDDGEILWTPLRAITDRERQSQPQEAGAEESRAAA